VAVRTHVASVKASDPTVPDITEVPPSAVYISGAALLEVDAKRIPAANRQAIKQAFATEADRLQNQFIGITFESRVGGQKKDYFRNHAGW
jgi:hypothetical protein